MASLKEIFETNDEQLLNKQVLLAKGQFNSVLVREKKNKNKPGSLKEVSIEGVPNNSIAFSLDKSNKPLTWMFSQSHPNTNKKCDFILVSPSGEDVERKYIVVFGELKSQNIDDEDCTIQLVNSHIFFKYIINIVNKYYRDQITELFEFQKNIDTRFVVLTNSFEVIKQSSTNTMVHDPDNDEIRIDVLLVNDNESCEKGGNEVTHVIEKGVVNYKDLLGVTE